MVERDQHHDRVAEHQKKSEEKLPRHVKDLIHYFHSLTEIYEYYRGFGNTMPEPLKAEISRAEAEVLQALEEETHQGGALHHYYGKQKEKAK